MTDKIAPFWILVHLEVIKLCIKLGEEIASKISEEAHGKGCLSPLMLMNCAWLTPELVRRAEPKSSAFHT